MTTSFSSAAKAPVHAGIKSRRVNPGHISSATTPETADNRRIIDAVVAVLDQGETLLSMVAAEEFARKNSVAFNASIGSHYRHCLDHFTCVLAGNNRPEINYDHRERNLAVETLPDMALQVTRQLRRAFEGLEVRSLNAPVMTRCEVSYEHGDSPQTGSTQGREIVYAIAHAIHHYALISVMARMMEIKLPEHFGVAPSTVVHQAAIQSSLKG